MSLIFLFIICAGAASVTKIVISIIQQQRHIDDLLLTKVTNGTIKYDKNYDRVIGHLGTCQKCRDRIDELIQGKDLMEHLVD